MDDLKIPNLDALEPAELRAAAQLFEDLQWYCLMRARGAESRLAGNLETAHRADKRADHFYRLLPPQARW